jgi:threonine dehydrogenase-like Zn-dependent dehydrogenase
MGAGYIDAREKSPGELMEAGAAEGNLDVIFEASGAADTAVKLMRYMSRSSIYVMTGIPREETEMELDAAQLVRQIVRYNQVVVGSVNSNRGHFGMALKDIPKINLAFGGVLESMLTQKVKFEECEKAFAPKDPAHIKTVIEVDPW